MSRPATRSIRAEPLLRAILDHTAAMVILHDQAGRIVEVNRHTCDLLGYTREQLLEMSVWDVEQEHRMTLGDHWDRYVPGKLEVMQGTHRRADGSTFPVEVRLGAFEHEGRKLLCATCQPTDEECDLAEEAPGYRRMDRQVFQRIFEEASEAMAIIDHEGRYLRQNQAHLALMGYDDDQLAGKTPAIHLGPAVFGQVAEGLAREGRYVGLHNSRTRSGEEVPLELTAFEIQLAPGEPPVFVGIKRPLKGRDLDHQTRADDERRQLEEELRQAQKMEVLGRLAAGVAHDFNNLLTPILGFADSELLSLSDEHPVAGSLRHIRQAAERGRDLTQQLLTFGRKRVLHLRTIDLGATVRRVASMLRRVLPEELTIQVEIDTDVARIDGDEASMEQVLMNLATNARDAIGGQPGTITFTLKNVTLDLDDPRSRSLGSPGEYVQLSVSDTGAGLDPGVRDRMFEPFFTDKPVGEGTGLGLSIVHGVVRQHDGVIHTETQAGQGTDVHILLHPSGVQAEEAPASITGQAKATVLITEDDPQVRSLLVRMLGVLGHPCLVAAGANQALAVADDHEGSIELLLSDVIMPDMTGDQLFLELKQRRPGIRVLFVSGYPRDGLSISSALGDELELMEKPFSLEQLRERLERILGGGSTRG